MKCYVVNLKFSIDRREYISAHLNELGIDFTLFEAVNGRELSSEEMSMHYNKEKGISLFYEELSPGEIGCSLSHIGIYKNIVANNIPCALIIEDDSKLSESVPIVIEKLESLYESNIPIIVLLSHVDKYRVSRKDKKINDKYEIVNIYEATQTVGYFITFAAAKILAENLYPVFSVADKWEHHKKLVPVKAVVPYCIGLSEYNNVSLIGSGDERSKKLMHKKYQKRGFLYYFERYFYKKFIFQIFIRPFLRVKKQKYIG